MKKSLCSRVSAPCAIFLIAAALILTGCSKDNNSPSGPAPVQTEGYTTMNDSYGFNFISEEKIIISYHDSLTDSWMYNVDSIDLFFFLYSEHHYISANPIMDTTIYWNPGAPIDTMIYFNYDYYGENIILIDNGFTNTIDDITEVPETGYIGCYSEININYIYAVHLKDETYAIVQIIDFDDSYVTFKWKYRPDGARVFF